MASKFPDSIKRLSAGSNTMIIANFADIDDGDTWDSYIPSAVAWWINLTDAPTQGSEGCDVAYSAGTKGTFTFNAGEDSRTGKLNVLAKI